MIKIHLEICSLKKLNIDSNYYYLYSNVLTTYSGYSKKFSINQSQYANEAIKKWQKDIKII